jgi:hypothetical protein
METTLNGKPAIKMKAELLKELGGINEYSFDGDIRKVSTRYSEYDREEGTLVIEKWLYEKVFAYKILIDKKQQQWKNGE